MLELTNTQYAIFNYLEAGLWLAICTVLLLRSRKESSNKATFIGLGVTLFLFGVSDIIEVHTGAWWKPKSLLFLKTGCVLSMIIWFSKYFTHKRKQPNKEGQLTP